MQEDGRRALFDATQRLGANYRELVVLSECKPLWGVSSIFRSEKTPGHGMAFYDQQFDLLIYTVFLID